MQKYVDDVATSNFAKSPQEILKETTTHFNAQHSCPTRGMTHGQIINRVHYVRSKKTGGDVFRMLELPNISAVSVSPNLNLHIF